ncbi:MAG: hypothetical protein R3318_03065 [Gammaproteobacteria bacterium]|nr:hypothetical protein [Gammaproteobacteria bacterium]
MIKSESGKRHISNIPPEGYSVSGHIKDSHDPNSIVSQYSEMVRSLQKESMEISSTPEKLSPGPHANTGVMQDMGDNTRSDFEKLIELEKRGGRADPGSGF